MAIASQLALTGSYVWGIVLEFELLVHQADAAGQWGTRVEIVGVRAYASQVVEGIGLRLVEYSG